jgi:hypothetical protein
MIEYLRQRYRFILAAIFGILCLFAIRGCSNIDDQNISKPFTYHLMESGFANEVVDTKSTRVYRFIIKDVITGEVINKRVTYESWKQFKPGTKVVFSKYRRDYDPVFAETFGYKIFGAASAVIVLFCSTAAFLLAALNSDHFDWGTNKRFTSHLVDDQDGEFYLLRLQSPHRETVTTVHDYLNETFGKASRMDSDNWIWNYKLMKDTRQRYGESTENYYDTRETYLAEFYVSPDAAVQLKLQFSELFLTK